MSITEVNQNDLLSFPTPFFLLDENILNQNIISLKESLDKYWKNCIIGYSVKTNPLPFLLTFLQKKGFYAEVVSEDEYSLVTKIGYDKKQIICNGPIKTQKWLEEILHYDIPVNVDSFSEVNYICEYAEKTDKTLSIGLRVNLDLEAVFPDTSNGGEMGSRFGFSFENGELSNVIDRLRDCVNVKIVGLHLHISTKTRTTDIYRWLTSQFIYILEKYELRDIKYFDIGGGFYGGLPDKPGWEDYLSIISQRLKESGYSADKLTLILEPGVSLTGGCFSYFAKVRDIKNTTRHRFVILDGSRTHIDPFMHKTEYFYQIISQNKIKRNLNVLASQCLAGFTCLENDRFFCLKDHSELIEGDMIRFDKVGAYTLALSPLFISYFPDVYMLYSSGKLDCVRKKWKADQFIQLSVF